jgi:hypothetical protein
MTRSALRDVARTTLVLFTLLVTASPARAQTVHSLLPDSSAARLAEFYNSEATTRFPGDARIAAGTTLRGNVAVLGGTLVVDGTIDGDVVVVNGDLDVRAGGAVRGSAFVTGGDRRNPAVYRCGARRREQPPHSGWHELVIEHAGSCGCIEQRPRHRTRAWYGNHHCVRGRQVCFGNRHD